jgi:BirA family biotin operon repressor/biotin-[acetyl-CoA-carboxylase] ligase
MSCSLPKTDFPHIRLHQTDSTQTALREALNDSRHTNIHLPEFFTLSADYQGAGHGQKGTQWESEVGQNLLASILLRPTFLPLDKQFLLSKAISLGVVAALRKLAPRHTFTIKWPNDLYHADRKLCGILIENNLDEHHHLHHALVGIGLNLNQETFIGDAPNPCSLIHLLGTPTPVQTALTLVVHHIRRQYHRLRREIEQPATTEQSINADYAAHLYRNDGACHLFQDATGTFRAQVQSVADDGHLTLLDEDGRPRIYAFKEVRIVP